MEIREEFDKLVEKLKTERDEINLKVHLASMEAREEFKEAEVKWGQVKEKASEIANEAVDTSEEYIAKAKVIGEELKEAYNRIAKRFSE
jgi:trans-2-enoyl-CoA reductase